MPFRDAHHMVGRIVALAEDKKCNLEQLSLKDFKSVDEAIDDRIFSVLSVENSVASRTSYGGTAPKNIRLQIRGWKRVLKIS